MKFSTYRFGIWSEKIAILMLILKGYEVLKKRYKTKFGEIDIIAKKKNLLVFVEVKSRRKSAEIEEILTPKQVARIRNAAEVFLSKNSDYRDYQMSFDFVYVNKFFWPKHYRNFIC